MKRTLNTDMQGITVSVFTRKETIPNVKCKTLISYFIVKPPGNVTIFTLIDGT